MGITYCLGKPSPLLPGENLLHTQRWLRLVSSKSFPSYRIAFNTWPFWTFAFEVTNRRFRVVSNIFLITTQDISIWYLGRNPEGDTEAMTGVSIQKSLIGRCIEVKSYNPERSKQWYWSPALTLRFYFKNPEHVERIILDAMK